MRAGRAWLGVVLVAGLAGCPASDPADDGNVDDPLIDAAGGTADAAGATVVDMTVSGEVLLANGYPGQIVPLLRADIAAGSALARIRLLARFCADAACATTLHVEPIDLDGADANGYYVPASAGLGGDGFAKAFTITRAPLGASFLQLVGDTQYSADTGLGVCADGGACPGDFDVVSIQGFQVAQNVDGHGEQPAALAVPIEIAAPGATLALADTAYLGRLEFDRGPLATPAPSDGGTLVAALSNAADDFRNRIGIVSLADTSTTPGALDAASYQLQHGAADFQGDVCGLIPGGGALYAIGIDNDGAHVFELSGSTGLQTSVSPIVTIPPDDPLDPSTFPWPCRGVYASVGGVEHLYLVQFKGAGSLDTSRPAPFYDVDLSAGTVGIPFGDTDVAFRGIAVDDAHLMVVDMSWSKYAVTNLPAPENRVFVLTRDGTGHVIGVSGVIDTGTTSDEQCDSNLHWPSGLAMATIDGEARVLVGHDGGVASFAAADGAPRDTLDLARFGRLFSQIEPSRDGTRMYALPQCKAINSGETFELPYGAGTEAADTNLVAILDTTGADLAVATTDIDIDDDGTPDHGIDLDYYHLKRYIRGHGTTLPIPPVVFTGPQLVVGEHVMVLRGSGIQGNGADAVSSSGLGQVQDLGVFDLATGRGVVYGDYVPWLDGLSAEAGAGGGIWGYDVTPGTEASCGGLAYLP